MSPRNIKQQYKALHPSTAGFVENNIYVYDWLVSVPSIIEPSQLIVVAQACKKGDSTNSTQIKENFLVVGTHPKEQQVLTDLTSVKYKSKFKWGNRDHKENT